MSIPYTILRTLVYSIKVNCGLIFCMFCAIIELSTASLPSRIEIYCYCSFFSRCRKHSCSLSFSVSESRRIRCFSYMVFIRFCGVSFRRFHFNRKGVPLSGFSNSRMRFCLLCCRRLRISKKQSRKRRGRACARPLRFLLIRLSGLLCLNVPHSQANHLFHSSKAYGSIPFPEKRLLFVQDTVL